MSANVCSHVYTCMYLSPREQKKTQRQKEECRCTAEHDADYFLLEKKGFGPFGHHLGSEAHAADKHWLHKTPHINLNNCKPELSFTDLQCNMITAETVLQCLINKSH